MSDPNDAWGNPTGDRSPREDTRDRAPSPRRDRSRSPAARNGGGDERPTRGEASQNQGNNLHVSGLARTVDQAMLDEIFGRHGKVYKAEIMLDPHSQESRGFGFVKMDTAEDAEAVIAALNGTTLEGKTLTVAHARRGRARTPTPGQYQGVKLDRFGGGGYGGGRGGGYDRPYQPRSYDSRYADRGPPRGYDDRRYDDRRYDDRRYDDRRGGYDDRRYDDRRGGDYRDDHRGAPPAGDRDYYRSERRDDRPRYDERSRYDERPRY